MDLHWDIEIPDRVLEQINELDPALRAALLTRLTTLMEPGGFNRKHWDHVLPSLFVDWGVVFRFTQEHLETAYTFWLDFRFNEKRGIAYLVTLGITESPLDF